MKSISDFLSKFRNLERPDAKKEQISQIIQQETGATLSKEQVIIQGNSLFIKLGGVAKTEILLKRQTILERISKEISGIKFENLH
ncbi:MAG TPA: hypothetical protein VFA52_03370 [Candidatus Paceibacterota bacterium]|nr:hypothetical protein [Candidatus Paceibacterota bacterium]